MRRSGWLARRATWLALLALGAAACAAPSGEAEPGADEAAPATIEMPDEDAPAREAIEVPDELPDSPPDWPWALAARGEDVPASVPLDEIRSGGPPPDGIPPIDDPVFESPSAAEDWLGPRDPVMVVDLDGDARAYPLAILTFHEIVNDVVGGEPLVVTYCPLCNSGLVFERTLGDHVLDFGTSGRLWHSNLVMYDRATRSLWSQFTGEAIVGQLLGARLERLPMQIVSWEDYKTGWPDGQVLSRDTGHFRPYGDNPYVGYDSTDRPFLFRGETGGPLSQMERVVTTGGEDDPVAYPLEELAGQRVLHDEIAGEPIVVLWAPGTASALDERDMSASRDVGATGVFRPLIDGDPVTLRPDGEQRFRDDETGSTWTVLGRAVDGPLAGAQLERVPHDDTFWFVQYAFRPETRVSG